MSSNKEWITKAANELYLEFCNSFMNIFKAEGCPHTSNSDLLAVMNEVVASYLCLQMVILEIRINHFDEIMKNLTTTTRYKIADHYLRDRSVD